MLTESKIQELTDKCKKHFYLEEFEDEEIVPSIIKDIDIELKDKFYGNDFILTKAPTFTKEQEYSLFKKLNYYKWLVSKELEFDRINEDKVEEAYLQYQTTRKNIIQSNMRLIFNIAKKFIKDNIVNLSSDKLDLYDLVQFGTFGLMRAVENFDFRRKLKFSTFSFRVIKNSFIDRRKYKESYWDLTDFEAYHNVFRSDVLIRKKDPYNYTNEVDYKIDAETCLNFLNEKERQVFKYYYFDNMFAKDIGAILGVGEARISKILCDGLSYIRIKLNQKHV